MEEMDKWLVFDLTADFKDAEESQVMKDVDEYLTNEYIQSQADERNISFEEMVEIIEKELSRFKK
jgi:hypothetical protein